MILKLGRFCHEMRLACTPSGYVDMVPASTQTQDTVVYIERVKAPMVLRPLDGTRLSVVGTAFFHGFMPDEHLLAKLKEEKECEDLILV